MSNLLKSTNNLQLCLCIHYIVFKIPELIRVLWKKLEIFFPDVLLVASYKLPPDNLQVFVAVLAFVCSKEMICKVLLSSLNTSAPQPAMKKIET